MIIYLLDTLHGMWYLSALTSDQTHPPTLEGDVSTTGPPGKFLYTVFLNGFLVAKG